jgi:LysR family hydrogen peroxide-inducible transcriptional activator
MKQVVDLNAWVNQEQDLLEGHYRVGIIPTLAPYVLPRIMPRLGQNELGIELSISEVTTERLIEQLKSGDLDVGILVTPLEESVIREIPLYSEPLMIFGHPHGKLDEPKEGWDPEDLPEERLLMLEEGHCFRNQILALCSKQRASSDKIRYESGSIASLQALVRAGMGYTLIPALAADFERDAEFIRAFAAPNPVREVSLVAHQSFPRERLLEWLRDQVKNSMPESYQVDSSFKRLPWRI